MRKHTLRQISFCTSESNRKPNRTLQKILYVRARFSFFSTMKPFHGQSRKEHFHFKEYFYPPLLRLFFNVLQNGKKRRKKNNLSTYTFFGTAIAFLLAQTKLFCNFVCVEKISHIFAPIIFIFAYLFVVRLWPNFDIACAMAVLRKLGASTLNNRPNVPAMLKQRLI